MKYKKIPETTFQEIQLNAGMIVKSFNPATREASGQIGATTGGVQFSATPTFSDYGEDIDNCPKNSMELKKLDEWEITLASTLITMNAETAKMLIAAADVDSDNSGHIIPRNDIKVADFQDIWWVGDYSDKNTGDAAGYIAIHMMNVINTGGFAIQSTDKAKGQFAFTFTAHYSLNAQDTVPFEVYILAGSDEVQPMISLDKHVVNITGTGSYTFIPTVIPEDAEITWSSASDAVAEVTDGVVTGVAAGNTVITASITEDGVTYTDTATVIVSAAG